MAACVAAGVFAATDAERIEALEKKVAELSRKVGVEAPLSVREAYAWHRARLMGLEGAVRHYELKADQLAQLSENAKRCTVKEEDLAKLSAEARKTIQEKIDRLKSEQKNRRGIFEKRKAELTKEELAKVEAEEKQRAAEERLSDELRQIRKAGGQSRRQPH